MRKGRTIRKTLPALCLVVLLMVFGMPAMAYGDTSQDNWTDHAATSFAGGDGSAANPYLIGTPKELAKLSKDVAAGEEYEGKYFKLTSDIDLSGHIWVPIGLYKWENMSNPGSPTDVPFRGSLDGDGHTITNMTVDQRTDQYSGGLFGNIRNASNVDNEIKNLVVKDARIYNSTKGVQLTANGILSAIVSSSMEHTVKITNVDTSGIITWVENVSDYDINGGMLGQATRATVTNCHVRNINIAGTDEKNDPNRTGGFVGFDNNSSYENCTAAGSISGGASMGGFVGCSEAEPGSMFRHCMADVKVHANDQNAGGFAGYTQYAKIYNCVAKGDVESTQDEVAPRVGGFAGDTYRITVENSHAAGKVPAHLRSITQGDLSVKPATKTTTATVPMTVRKTRA